MKRSLLTLLLIPLFFLVNAQSLGWVKQLAGDGLATPYSMAVDKQGNVYSVGWLNSSCDFDPGAGTVTLTANTLDGYVSKLDKDGNYQWAYNLGGKFEDRINDIALDAAGNVYLTGFFDDSIDLDPTTGVMLAVPQNNRAGFLIKLDSIGMFQWAKVWQSNQGVLCTSVTINATGHIIVGGGFTGTVDLDPDAGVSTVTAAFIGDAFVADFDASGSLVWAKHIKSTFAGSARVDALATDGSGNVFVTGAFSNKVDFDPAPALVELTSVGLTGNPDVYLLKLSSQGNFSWVKQLGGDDIDIPTDLVVDGTGAAYISGYFNDTADFDATAAINNFISRGLDDGFLLKFDNAGNQQWSKQFGGGGYDEGWRMVYDNSFGYIYLTGAFSDTVDFDPGAGTNNLMAQGDQDIYLSKIDVGGNFLWTKQFGGPFIDASSGIGISQTDNVYMNGYFLDHADYDPGVGVATLTDAQNSMDGFVLKMDIATGLEEVTKDKGLLAYPNPFNDVLYITADDFTTTGVRVYDLLGAEVPSEINLGKTTAIKLTAATGIYVAAVKDNLGQIHTCRLIKN
ncbi:MAG: SBBP repeat-containing protein [Chitinophagales bacterium]